MFLCLRVPAPGICWYTRVGEGRGKGYSWERQGKETGCLLSQVTALEHGAVPGASGAASICFSPGRLCCSVAWTWGREAGRVVGTLSSPYSGLFLLSWIFSPFWGSFWINDLMPFQQRNIGMLVLQTAGGTGLDNFPVGVSASLTFVWRAYPFMTIGYMHYLRGINLWERHFLVL